MKKLLVIIVILIIILIAMILRPKIAIKEQSNVNINEIEQIENYIESIYMWKEITNEALPTFENINEADEKWIWEVVKQNLEDYEVTEEKINEKAKEIFGSKFLKKFPKEGNESLEYKEETGTYISLDIDIDKKEDLFLLDKIEKTKEGYEVEIIEYLADYEEETSVAIKNTNEEEIGKIAISEVDTKKQEIVKNNKERFTTKKLILKKENEKKYVEKVTKGM